MSSPRVISVTVAEVSVLAHLARAVDPETVTGSGDMSTDEIRALMYRLRTEIPDGDEPYTIRVTRD